MKIKKPEDEKYFKDIVLNDILEEISNETGAPKPAELKKKTTHKKKYFSKGIFFIIIAILFFFFVMTLLNLVTDATTEAKPISTIPTHTIAETEDWKMDEDIGASQKTTLPKVIKAKPIVQKKVQTKTIEMKAVKPKPIPKQKTERELAKEALRQQMLQ